MTMHIRIAIQAVIVVLWAGFSRPCQGAATSKGIESPSTASLERLDSLVNSLTRRLDSLTAAIQHALPPSADSSSAWTAVQVLQAEISLLRARLEKRSNSTVASIGSVVPRAIPLAGADSSLPLPADPRRDFALTGFVSGSSDRNNRTSRSTFGLNQIELDGTREFVRGVSARADIEYISGSDGTAAFGVEQGYVAIGLDPRQNWQLTFGKFNAPIGLEAADPNEMWHASWGLTGNTLPANLTGGMITGSITSNISLCGYLVNGWDRDVDNNVGKTFGMQIASTISHGMSLALSAISGPEQDTIVSSHRAMLDIVASGEAGVFAYGAEFLSGRETKLTVTGGAATWDAGMALLKWNCTGSLSLRARYSYFNDNDGIWTGGTGRAQEYSLAPAVELTNGLALLGEIRYEHSSSPIYPGRDNELLRETSSNALRLTYSF